jgi:molybdopterin-synthase adenylyltransferase
MFTEEQLQRYSRHIILKGFGPRAQRKLLDSSVLVIGAGGLGSPALLYLAAAGAGKIGIADYDAVEISNLQRQILYSQHDLNIPKTTAAAARISELNSDTQIIEHNELIQINNIIDIIKDYDFVIDGTDSKRMKLLINDACIIAGKSFSHAGALEFAGQLMTIVPHKSACLRCVFETLGDDSLSCAQAGIIGAVVGVVGTLQALEAIKYLTGVGELLTDSFLSFQGDITRFHKLQVKRNPLCVICGHKPLITNLNVEQYETCR